MTQKEYKFVNSTLMSGSADVFRTAIGGYWRSVVSETDSTFVELEGTPLHVLLSDVDSDGWLDPETSLFTAINNNEDLIENTSNEVVYPSRKTPVRILGNADTVKNDKHWEIIFTGGTFGDETYVPILPDTTFEKTYFIYNLPYSKREEKEMSDLGLSSIQVSYEYNSFLPPYEEYVKSERSELLIPNYYLFTDLSGRDFSEGSADLDLYDSQIISYASREGQYKGVGALYKLNTAALAQIGFDKTAANPAQLREKNKRYTNLTTTYLTPTLQQYPLSSSTVQYMENKMKNIYLDANALDRLYVQKRADSSWSRKKFPFYVKIDFPLDHYESTFANVFKEEQYTARFLKVLKEAFMGEIDNPALNMNITPESVAYDVLNRHQMVESINDELPVIRDTSTVTESNYNTLDFGKLLFYMYNNYKSVSDDGMYIGENTIDRLACFDTTGAYRHFNNIAATKIIETLTENLQNQDDQKLADGVTPLSEIYDDMGQYVETLVYRVQKVGGTPSGDSRAQNTLQNYWFMNTEDIDDFTFIDSQVKYGVDYTYNVYAYVLTIGRKYKFSNLLLTNQLGYEEEHGTGEDPGMPAWGVEFYDPTTGETADQLYYTDDEGDSPDPDPIDNTYATLSQAWLSAPYAADAYLEYEYYSKITEIPIYSKTLKILDNPANATNVFPYQHSNASNKIGFGLHYDTFSEESIPEALSSTDISLHEAYANANDLLEDEKILLESVSRPRFVEIYRIAHKPTSRTDFAAGLISTIDLKIPKYKTPENTFTGDTAPHSTYTYTNTFFDEKVRTNQDYYYLFRILNEQRSLAQWSDIYKVNLVDDGGFIYSLFDTFFESDLEENTFVTPSKDIKKLIHLQPSEWHMDLNTEAADFNETAQSQLRRVFAGSAEDLIWGKTFKVRLTSKKTGKKIDLNITYNLNRE